MSIYIPGLSLPKNNYDFPLEICVTADGTVTDVFGCPIMNDKAIEVPPHGRLVDADAFFNECPELTAYEPIAETVIPADKDGDTK